MKQAFIKNISLILALNFIVKLSWIFVIDISVQNMVGPEAYGIYFSLYSFVLLFSFILDPGLHYMNNREIARDANQLIPQFRVLFPLKITLFLLFSTLCLGVAWLIGYDSYHFSLLFPLLGLHFFMSMITYLRSNISGLLLFTAESMFSVLDRFLGIVICASILLAGFWENMQIEWYIYIQLFAYMISSVWAFMILKTRLMPLKLNWQWQKMWSVLKDAGPYALSIALLLLYTRIDVVLLERLLPVGRGDFQAGIYASAFRLTDAANMVPALFIALLLPMFSSMRKKKEDIYPLWELSSTLLYILAFSFSVLCVFYGFDIMSFIYPNLSVEGVAVLKYLSVGFVFSAIQLVGVSVLMASGQIRKVNQVYLVASVVNILGNLIFIPLFEAEGAAWIHVVTQAICCFGGGYVIFKSLNFNFSTKWGAKILGFSLWSSGFAYFCSTFVRGWGWSIAVCLCLILIGVFLFQLVGIKDVKGFCLIKK